MTPSSLLITLIKLKTYEMEGAACKVGWVDHQNSQPCSRVIFCEHIIQQITHWLVFQARAWSYHLRNGTSRVSMCIKLCNKLLFVFLVDEI
jgi:hypothetical protein